MHLANGISSNKKHRYRKVKKTLSSSVSAPIAALPHLFSPAPKVSSPTVAKPKALVNSSGDEFVFIKMFSVDYI